MCIKEWANIESRLYDLCALILKADPKHVAIVYYRTPNIDARLSLTNELVLASMPRPDRVWAKLIADIRSLLKTRNLLAHAPVGEAHSTEWVEYERGTEPVESRWFHVTTSYGERLRGRQTESIDQPDLPYHFENIQAVETRLDAFISGLKASAKKGLRAKHPRQITRHR
jgi:hypothetical protein